MGSNPILRTMEHESLLPLRGVFYLKLKVKKIWATKINLWYNNYIFSKKEEGIIMMVNIIKAWFNYSNSPKCAHFNDAYICRTR